MSGHEQSVMALSTDAEGGSDWDDSYNETENSEEARNEEAQYEKTLQECQERFGNQLFAYMTSSGQKVGTITDIITECSAVKMYILEGPDAVARFVSGYEVTNEKADELLNPKVEDKPPTDEDDEDKPTAKKKQQPKIEEPVEKTEKVDVEIIQAEQKSNDEPAQEQVVSASILTSLPVSSPDAVKERVAQIEQPESQPEPASGHREIVELASRSSGIDTQPTVAPSVEPISEAQSVKEIVAANEVGPSEPMVDMVEKNDATDKLVALESQEKDVLVEKIVEPTEIPTKAKVPINQEVIEHIDVEEVSDEVFHMPEITVLEKNEQMSDDEIVLDGTEMSTEPAELENEGGVEMIDAEEDLLPMDAAVKQIEDAEEIEGEFETADVAEIEDETHEIDIKIDAETENDEKSEMVSLQSVIEQEQTVESEGNSEIIDTLQYQAITEVITKLTGGEPEKEISAYNSEQIQNNVAALAEHIEVLQKSKNEQECREAIIGLRKELADLLTLLGYQDVDARVAEMLRKNHDMVELKRIMNLLLQASISDETLSNDMTVTIRPHHKFGQWVVGRTTVVLQSA